MRIQLLEFEISWNKVANVQTQLEKLVEKNYFLNLSAREAFKSYIRAYDSHGLKDVFNINSLNLIEVAKSFGFTNPPWVDLPVSHKVKKEQKSRRDYYKLPIGVSKKQKLKSMKYRVVPLKNNRAKNDKAIDLN